MSLATAFAAFAARLEAAERARVAVSELWRVRYDEIWQQRGLALTALASATAEVERLRKGRDEYERQIASRDRTVRADSAALAAATAEAERLRVALDMATEIAIDAVTMSGLVDNVPPGSGWQKRIRDYCAAVTPAPSK